MIEEELVPRFTNPHDAWFDFGRTGGYLKECQRRQDNAAREYQELIEGVKSLTDQRSHEYGVYIIEAMETNSLTRINGNVPNDGLITNLPEGCCVEVPCLVDGGGVRPTVVGDLPPQLAALNRTNINVQELIVEAALTGSKEAVYHAASLDPRRAHARLHAGRRGRHPRGGRTEVARPSARLGPSPTTFAWTLFRP